jgi:uncharacterized protein (TIGR03435 family)
MMVQSLFKERFKLRMHRQTKTVSAYALVTARNGPKLPPRGFVDSKPGIIASSFLVYPCETIQATKGGICIYL